MSFLKSLTAFILLSLFSTNVFSSEQLQSKVVMLSLEEVSTITELHQTLKIKFSFPEYYGNNWDAFDESIREVLMDTKITLFLSGKTSFMMRFPRDAKLFFRLLKDLEQGSPDRLTVLGRRD